MRTPALRPPNGAPCAPAHEAPGAFEKRCATVHARVSEQLALFLDDEARASGVSKSAVLADLLSQQRAAMILAGQRVRGTPRHEFLVKLDGMVRLAEKYLGDDHFSVKEKTDFTRELVDLLRSMYPERRARA